MDKVRKLGCKIAIDDFGSGYSNFEYLIRLNADYIKIDGSLIKDILINKNNQEIVITIVDFAKRQGFKTIAEFVSSKEIFEKVKELGIDYAQGYYINEPKLLIKEEKA
ncbi:MAG: EAL domain-containing protein [Arcobacter sp.]